MSYELEGVVNVLEDSQTFGSGFEKREFVVTVEDGKYPQEIKLECVQGKVGLLDGVNVGDEVKVMFNLRGSEHNGRYFVNLQCWKLANKGGGAVVEPSVGSDSVGVASDGGDAADDIPF